MKRIPVVLLSVLTCFLLTSAQDKLDLKLIKKHDDQGPEIKLSTPAGQEQFRRQSFEKQKKISDQFSKVYHVAPKGSDSNDGSPTKPFQTIQKALDIVQPGEKVIVRPGLYNERLEFKISGLPGKPIVLEGERGPQGEWLTIIDGAKPVGAIWEPAPEIGERVYKTGKIPFEPRIMIIGDKYIPRIWEDHMQDGEGFKKLAYAPDMMVETHYLKVKINYWDAIEGMYGSKDKITYIRFRNGDNPNNIPLRAASAGGAVNIRDRGNIAVRNFLVRGNENAILIEGQDASDNIIEENFLINGYARVLVRNGAARNHIRYNEIKANFYADKYQPGAWGDGNYDGTSPYELAVKEFFYTEYKMFFGPDGTGDYGINVYCAGDDNKIYGNYVHQGGQGIHCSATNKQKTRRLKVYNNIVHNFSSIGLIVVLSGVQEIELFRNLVYDCNINLRIHHVNELGQDPGRSLYVYENFFYQLPGRGSHIYFHYNDKQVPSNYPHAGIFIYQNSFAGGHSGISISGWAEKYGGLPGAFILNNVFSSGINLSSSRKFFKAEGMIGGIDYNWFGGVFKTKDPDYDYTKAPWYGKNNIRANEAKMWDDSRIPDFVLPENSPARQAGMDLSHPFVVNGKEFKALPGMEPGYFSGTKPDMGAKL